MSSMKYATSLLGALAALPAVHCLAFGGPAPTNTSPNRALDGFTPKPTKGPSIAELRRRQDAGAETCGWVNEDFSSAVTCNGARSCVLYTTASGGTTAGMAGCCSAGDTQNCGWAYSCIDYNSYSAGGCDSSCEADDFVKKCTATDAPYCTAWMYASDSVFDYGCGAESISTYQTIYPIGVSGSVTSSVLLETISDDAIAFSDASSAFSDISTDLASATDTEIFPNYTTDTLDTATDSNPQQTNLPTIGGGKTKTKKGKKKVSIGLILGVVLGALVILGVIAAVVIILCLKQKKKKQLAANQVAIANAQSMRPQSTVNQQPQMQQAPPPMPAAVPQQQNTGAESYFNQPQAYGNDYKVNPQVQTYDVSSPNTPAPAYVQPQYAGTPVASPPPPMPTPSPALGAHEVDAISVAHTPGGQPGQVVHEIGGR